MSDDVPTIKPIRLKKYEVKQVNILLLRNYPCVVLY